LLFAIIAEDRPDGLEHRMAVRPAHLEHLKALADRLVLAGPFLDAAGKPCGSLVIIEAADQAEAEAMAARDPYVKEALFESYQVRPWNWAINNPDRRGQ
jgi:uncharacterized protein YciI